MAKNTDKDLLKDKGFLSQRQDDYFSMRLHAAGGNLTSDYLRAVADAADRYGKGYVHVTSRQGIEIPFVHLENTDAASEQMNSAGIGPGASGKKIRAVVACQGDRVCKRGLIDCQGICEKIDKLYFGKPVPYKFKIAVTGCPASCLKVQENDFGIMGFTDPVFIEENCVMCRLCEKACEMSAITIDNGSLYLDMHKCVSCGLCVKACRKDAMQVKGQGYTIFVGGKVGKRPRMGDMFFRTGNEEVVFDILEKTIDYYRENALEGERLGDVIDRCGLDQFGETIKYSRQK
ncbi:4Fe-4S binding protein [Methanolobus mangrovi]|uniref:4Fe-4S binding protein n=1 Tax=Methanolobus mangrovi TaxID=3072977 RepID=A0AA51YIB3_9EURY|nr:4Fe-4S binding protein [Methanolobus mangrovi]WMW21363.1 4Fe-4S binding protein [Methanolobus mangrovi]